MSLDVYENCVAMSCVFSPSVYVDSSWVQVAKYIAQAEMKVSIQMHRLFFVDRYVRAAFRDVFGTQLTITDFMKA